MSQPDASSVAAGGSAQSAQGLVLRNTLFLVIAQLIVVPLSVFTNAMVARFLGPVAFGQMYLAMTYVTFAFLFVEFGQGGTLTGLIAQQRARAGELLGSGLAWRALAIALVALVLIGICYWAAYTPEFQRILMLVLLASALGTISMACHDVFRGYERTDIGAITYVAWKLLTAIVVVPVLLLGGRLQSLLWAQAACAAVGAVYLLSALRSLGVPQLQVRRTTIKELVVKGLPFLAFALVIALQESVDAAFLSKLASSEAVGWHAAARKLIGLLIYPAVALISALYPTLSRLHVEDRAAFTSTAASALRVTILLAMPLAAGCALFPDLGVWIFSSERYGPATDNLRILSVYLFLVYFSMPLGTSIMAAGGQRAWAMVQLGCVLVSVVLDPWLIPIFQHQSGNGGLAVCIASVLSEVLMISGGLYLAPKGLFDRVLLCNLAVAMLGGTVMMLVAWSLSGYASLLVAPLALLAYAITLYALGALTKDQLLQLRRLFGRA